MSIARSLPLPGLPRVRDALSRAALLAVALAALATTTGCDTCCRRCPPPCPPPCPAPCCDGAPSMPMPPPLPPPLPPAPNAPGSAQEKVTAEVRTAPTIEACRPFLSPPGTKSMPDVASKGTTLLDSSQLDKGGFVLWQVQNGMWQHVGWAFKMPNSDTEHWVYKPNFVGARCAMPTDGGTAWTLAFQCVNPGIQDLEQFFEMIRNQNAGSFSSLLYRTHALAPGAFPP